jgi:hypothetical protein
VYATGINIATSDGIPYRKPGTSNTGTLFGRLLTRQARESKSPNSALTPELYRGWRGNDPRGGGVIQVPRIPEATSGGVS